MKAIKDPHRAVKAIKPERALMVFFCRFKAIKPVKAIIGSERESQGFPPLSGKAIVKALTTDFDGVVPFNGQGHQGHQCPPARAREVLRRHLPAGGHPSPHRLEYWEKRQRL